MAWVSIALLIVRMLYTAFKYGPQIAALVRTIIDLIKGTDDDNAKLAYAAELSDAFNAYKADKDERPLRDLLHRILTRHVAN